MIRSKSVLIEELQNKVKKLQKQLTNNKIFLNMVIHDMRNPTNSIEFAVKEVIKLLQLVNKQSNGSLPDNKSVNTSGKFHHKPNVTHKSCNFCL